ncbi:ATP-dependent DNA helicase [Campylobacter gracilis]|uniref:DEAD/DEAH box helicase n=3 Tax=Campylobacter gracilis TaxID=824 RepID=C8PG28_9BACT|nr:ATP-dependent DNA helicase [Campylobacter gracilis]EEV18066.1 DEAD/DEAH box helicase [Campylobacter gracilis RM3268]SUW82170.1 ATP-dependent DNA helicase RecG [Campylobacter gracilis]
MIFEAKDAATLQKAGITTLLDLALLLPKSFDDLSVGDAPCAGESTAEVECLFQHRRGSMLIVTAHCLSWEREIKIVIFNAKSWHFGAFKRGKKFFIHGKCDESFGSWQFVNPKIVSEPGRIAPKYKAALSDAAAQKLIKKYLSADALLACGLHADEAAVLLALHESSPRSVRMLAALNRQLKEGGAENFGERDDVSNSGRIPSGSEILNGGISNSDKILNDDGISDNGEIPSSQSSAAEILNGRSQNDEIFGGKISVQPQGDKILACEVSRGAANEILSGGISKSAETSLPPSLRDDEIASDKILDGDQPRVRCAEIYNDENFDVQSGTDFLAVYGAEARGDEISNNLKADNDAAANNDKISNDLVFDVQAAARPADAQASTAQPMLEHVATEQSIAAQQNSSTQDVDTQFATTQTQDVGRQPAAIQTSGVRIADLQPVAAQTQEVSGKPTAIQTSSRVASAQAATTQTLSAQATGAQPVCNQTENLQTVVAVRTATAKPTIAQTASAEAVQDALAAPMNTSRDCAAQATTAIPTIAQIASEAETIHAAETVRAAAVTQMSGTAILRTLKFVEILNYLQKLSAKKTSFPAQIYPLRDISDWLASLPFEPTRDQLSAIKDIASDLQSPLARRRVVMGDVGSGKTLVILASAAMNYPRISYLMAPTSILAEQIYAEARRLLPPQIKVLLVKSGDREPNFADAHLIIGTHALLYHELAPSNLIMVDEQHRFGSNQREKIARLTENGEFRAHFIQFSATPIPRTLSMIQSELVSFSFLKQLPFEKRIKTKILQNDGFTGFMQDLRRELAAGNQAIIVYPLVQQSESSVYQSLEEAAPFWKAQFADVMITHGSDKDKEEILRRFRDDGRLLITTTIVEVGISLPRLSVILIVGAERMGLASLHQLRGRVGRKGQAGRCYLYTKLKSPPQRLREFAATLDGFKVANIDLKNRQGGDLLGGSVQHGAMFAWYDYEEDVTAAAKQRLKDIGRGA